MNPKMYLCYDEAVVFYYGQGKIFRCEVTNGVFNLSDATVATLAEIDKWIPNDVLEAWSFK